MFPVRYPAGIVSSCLQVWVNEAQPLHAWQLPGRSSGVLQMCIKRMVWHACTVVTNEVPKIARCQISLAYWKAGVRSPTVSAVMPVHVVLFSMLQHCTELWGPHLLFVSSDFSEFHWPRLHMCPTVIRWTCTHTFMYTKYTNTCTLFTKGN